jgi:hypothetical protein
MSSPITTVLIALCANAGKIKGLVAKHFPSAVEKEALRAAAESNGRIDFLAASQLPYPIIRIGRSDFGDVNDPASMAKYHDALRSLCSNGYVQYTDDLGFRLTGEGFNKARLLP